MSEKISERHLRRKAVLYIRQSTAHQLSHNQESRRLQYAMKDRLQRLGWREVDVVDDDLGRSAAGTVRRQGFQRMVEAVVLGEVGAVAARELSRFARNSHDWQKLIDVCRMVDTVLIDEEAIYDSRTSNDRLLLGLKGTLNEYELDLLRLRALEARRAKAARGAYFARVPAGFVKLDGALQKDPDRRVQERVELVFAKVFELGSVQQALLWLCEQGLELPRNRKQGVVWKQATYTQLIHMVKNPLYAGAYVFGKTATVAQLSDGELRRRVRYLPRQQWPVLLPNHHEAYISWEQFERLEAMLAQNSQTIKRPTAGAAKKGMALLSGLVRCRRCGHKLFVSYSGETVRIHRYTCCRAHQERGDPPCISFSGLDVDARVGAEVLKVVQPAAVEATRMAARASADQYQQLLGSLRVDLEAARYAADRARQQFDAADPKNRLVADELERRWETALRRVRDVEERISIQEQAQAQIKAPAPEAFATLAHKLDRVWNDPAVSWSLKKRIVRTVIEQIIADVDENRLEIILVVHWKGGVHTELRIPKRRKGVNATATPIEVIDAVRTLALICDDTYIAGWLSKNNILTGKGRPWSKSLVASLRSRLQIPRYSPAQAEADGWLTKQKAAAVVGVAELTLQRAVEAGEIDALRPLPRGPWIFKKSDLLRPEVLSRLQQRRVRRADKTVAHPSDQLPLVIPNR